MLSLQKKEERDKRKKKADERKKEAAEKKLLEAIQVFTTYIMYHIGISISLPCVYGS